MENVGNDIRLAIKRNIQDAADVLSTAFKSQMNHARNLTPGYSKYLRARGVAAEECIGIATRQVRLSQILAIECDSKDPKTNKIGSPSCSEKR